MKKFFLVFALNFMYWATYFVVIFVFLLLLKDASDPKYITEARERDLIRSVVLMFFWPAVLNYLINYIYVIRFLKAKQFLTAPRFVRRHFSPTAPTSWLSSQPRFLSCIS